MVRLIDNEIQRKLFTMQDVHYRDFQRSLIPSIKPETIIGVRTPLLRTFSREIIMMQDLKETPKNKSDPFIRDCRFFTSILPHYYFEENQLQIFIISRCKDFKTALTLTDTFLPYINNWATCDQLRPKIFTDNLPDLYAKCTKWINSEKTYSVRFAIGLLLSYFLDDPFPVQSTELVASIKSDEYYVNMMIAWYFATALAKQWDAAISFLEENKLSVWVHNKTIQKAIESFRVTDEHKDYLRTLKRIEP